ncbi:pimeloyl-ACP methyl ester carboxylesterase [Alkalibacillus flavidus]|uniref:Pimeloyl-ACP methyl ester carboxylesterase n=1 Tax=Alkalibacillus flavidus TaxID=546021 RepID=A0ABV2KXL3_9BACI
MRKWLWLAVILVLIGCTNESESTNETDPLDDLLGVWHGQIEVPNMPLNIQLTFEHDEQDQIVGFIDIPAQGISRYPLSSLEHDEGQVRFQMDVPGQFIEFVSDLPSDGKLTGDFKQQGHTFDFALEEGELMTQSEANEEVDWLSVETEVGTLKGELEQPSEATNETVALIIPGSGPTDRNGNGSGVESDSLKLLAESLASQGVASLRYGKRGAGENQDVSIPEEEMTIERMAEDAVQWIERLNEDYKQVVVIGHSQGALIGQLAALQTDVDGFISIAGAGRPIDDVLQDQLEQQLPQDSMQQASDVLEQLREGNMVEEEAINSELYSIFRPTIQPFLMSWMAYDPADSISELEVPPLIIQGTHDRQVTEEDAERLAEAHDESQLVIVYKMDHVLKVSDGQDDLSNYKNPNEPLSDRMLEALKGYISNETVEK